MPSTSPELTRPAPAAGSCVSSVKGLDSPAIALLTGGGDRPYALGLSTALAAQGMTMDFIGSDELRSAELEANPRIRFLNLKGDQSSEAGFLQKMGRVHCLLCATDGIRRRSQAPSLSHPVEQQVPPSRPHAPDGLLQNFAQTGGHDSAQRQRGHAGRAWIRC